MFWKSELLHYLVEKRSYTAEEAYYLKKLQQFEPSDIKVTLHTSIDAFCYTSDLLQKEYNHEDQGIFFDEIGEDRIKNYIFNRSYILNKLGASEEDAPDFTNELTNKKYTFEDEAKKHIVTPKEEKEFDDLDNDKGVANTQGREKDKYNDRKEERINKHGFLSKKKVN